MKTILFIDNLTISINKKILISNLTLSLKQNEIHVLMGPNGSGKSSLAKVLVGHPSYKIVEGNILYNSTINLLKTPAVLRSHLGLFLAFQNPLEIPGITNYEFLRLMYNQKQRFLKKAELTPLTFFNKIQKLLQKLNLNVEFLNRNVNENFSGGEKKSNEILQLLVLEPTLIILDEIDAGMDFDLINLLFNKLLKSHFKNATFLIITHNPKILSYITPSWLHILMKGKLVKSGQLELLTQLENFGYNSFL